MDGVERVMVLGIFIVIVLILGVLAWDATHEETQAATVPGNDGGSGAAAAGLPEQSPFSEQMPRGESLSDEHLRATGGKTAKAKAAARQKDKKQAPRTGPAPRGPKKVAGGGAPRPGPVALKNNHVDKPVGPRKYTVKEGDTVWKIAFNELGSGDMKALVDAIQALNPGADLDWIKPGQVLTLPAQAPATSKLPGADELDASGKGRHYKVQPNDTLRGIAARELGSAELWDELYRANRHLVDSPEKLSVGVLLTLPEIEG